METVTLAIGLISMVATVVSTVIAIKAKNEAKIILNEVKNIEMNSKSRNHDIKNKGKINIKNEGDNDGVMAGIVTGGIDKGVK
ncbi:hypothetical protein [Paenibacillus xylanexedens]|uniref:hypothetical protein n=1 Tax=Paenibacillus xylanexedens TaxID=528191 RepID=UPI001C8E092B|nr:hypothetical protein [Paenibacillus xylanexedens]MBY0118353.1 hypothetical protein [Paenibacillus xylanexedens]